MGPAADARRRLALVPEPAHVELLARNIPALQHPQHHDQSLDLRLGKAKLLCGFEVLYQHVVLLLPRVSFISAPATARNALAGVLGRATLLGALFCGFAEILKLW